MKLSLGQEWYDEDRGNVPVENQPESATVKAIRLLREDGAEKKPNGKWYQDGVYLADNARDALSALRG